MEVKDANYRVFVKMYDSNGVRMHNWMATFKEYFDFENFVNLEYENQRKIYPNYRVEFEYNNKIKTSEPYNKAI